ncbi:hypothetical protein OESDEN_04638 [Oesophagostomum dentatum]|uniref:Uncharacterized protein n=1 Tax=Oesophagostomum dentatum TaxID=61180 RepID=A0A0B1TDQ5_OESDE|nr:hypothetical protein OESDEN_04638 [Oesophagostomum dentatum]
MYPAREQDLPDLIATRRLIEQNIEKWLNSAEATSSSTSRTDTASRQPSSTSKSTLQTSPAAPTSSTVGTTTPESGVISTSFIGINSVLLFLTVAMLLSQ